MKPRSLPVLFLAAVLLFSALAGCGGAAPAETPAPTPDEAARLAQIRELTELTSSFFEALASGDGEAARRLCPALPAEAAQSGPAEALTSLVRRGLSWAPGDAQMAEEGAAVTGTLTRPDTAALLSQLEDAMAASLRAQVEEARLAADVYDENGWLPETLERAWAEVLETREAPPVLSEALTLTLRPGRDGWVIEADDALLAALDGLSAEALAPAAEHLFTSQPVIPKVYRLERGVTAAPAPDPDGFGSAASPGEIDAVYARPAAQRLLGEQASVWNGGAELKEDSVLRYYLDDSILAVVWQESRFPATVTWCEIVVGDGSQLFRKLTGDVYGSSFYQVPTALAAEANAVAAIDADFYRARNYGVNVYQGDLYRWEGGAVDSCFFTAGGDMLFAHAGEITTREEAQAFLDEHDIVTGIAFGPIMVEDGVNVTPPRYPDGDIAEKYARCCLGQVGERHYLLCAVDYWASVSDVADMMIAKGVRSAYNVDGGQSGAIILGGEQLNPNIFQVEKPQSDILCFGSAIPRD